MLGEVMQAVRTGIDVVESGIGGCVLGTAATAAAVYGGFRLAGYRLGLTCQRLEVSRKEKKPDNLTDYYAVTMEEADANAAYSDASVHWNAMKKQYEAAKLEKEADQLELDAGRLREERRK
ncbi:MAG: hypothetical protein IJT94_12745, partial [Oscillibacter sp.]|nr:hypothetical protein [Oscillibacter sp.]